MNIKLSEKEGTEIDTIDGVATYLHTELENQYGNWNDNYYISNGYFLIHEGVNHHVYKAEKKRRGA